MDARPGSGSDRRASVRCPLEGSAILFQLGRVVGTYALLDLSVGGCRLAGSAAAKTGTLHHVVIRRRGRATVRQCGFVVRCHAPSPGRWEVGIAFLQPRGLPVRQLVKHPGRILLVHRSPRVLQSVSAALASEGYRVIEAASADEALWELENGASDFLAIAIGGDLGAGQELLTRYLHTRAPQLPRLAIDDLDSAALLSAVATLAQDQPLPPSST